MKTTKLLTENDVRALKTICESVDHLTTFDAKVKQIARRERVTMAEVMAEFSQHDPVELTMEEGFAQLAAS